MNLLLASLIAGNLSTGKSALIVIGARVDFVDGGELDIDALFAGALQTIGPNEAWMRKPRWSAFHQSTLDSH